MENTVENKVKFCALYIYQKVFWHEEYKKEVGLLDPIRLDLGYKYVAETGYKLLLKSISSITKKDLEILNYSDSYNEMLKAGRVHQIDSFAADVLRSLGYAIPWMGLSVEKQIEFGWIKIM